VIDSDRSATNHDLSQIADEAVRLLSELVAHASAPGAALAQRILDVTSPPLPPATTSARSIKQRSALVTYLCRPLLRADAVTAAAAAALSLANALIANQACTSRVMRVC
jgi:anti-sigma factor RsiW